MKKIILVIAVIAIIVFGSRWMRKNSNLDPSEIGYVIDKVTTDTIDSSAVIKGSIYEKRAEYRQTSIQQTQYTKKQVCKSNVTKIWYVGKYKVSIQIKEGIPYKTESDTLITITDFYGTDWYKYPTLINNNPDIKNVLVKRFLKR